jgi:type II secretory pathway pseudopilin PulG
MPTTEAGFTLVEALTAILILVIGLMAVTNLMVVSTASNVAANQGTAAATAASEALESLRSQPFCTATGPCTPNPALNAGGDLDADDPGPPPYWTEAPVPGVGVIHTRWQIVAIDAQTRFIRVRSEARGGLGGARTRAEFTTFRSCTAVATGCP